MSKIIQRTVALIDPCAEFCCRKKSTPHNLQDMDTATLENRVPLGRIGSNVEFGADVAYLASEEAGFVTGRILNLSGGLHIG